MEDFLHERGRLCEKPFTHLYKALLPKKYLVSKQKVSKKRATPVPGNRKKIGSSAKKKLAENATSLNFAHFFCFLDICFKTQSLLSVRNTRAVSLRVFFKKPEIWNVWFVKNIWFPNTTKSRLSPKQRECVSAADGKSRCWESRSFMKTRQWGVSSRITPLDKWKWGVSYRITAPRDTWQMKMSQ